MIAIGGNTIIPSNGIKNDAAAVIPTIAHSLPDGGGDPDLWEAVLEVGAYGLDAGAGVESGCENGDVDGVADGLGGNGCAGKFSNGDPPAGAGVGAGEAGGAGAAGGDGADEKLSPTLPAPEPAADAGTFINA